MTGSDEIRVGRGTLTVRGALGVALVGVSIVIGGGIMAQSRGVEQVAHAVDSDARQRLDVLAADVAAVRATQATHSEQLAEIRQALAEIQRSLGRVEGR